MCPWFNPITENRMAALTDADFMLNDSTGFPISGNVIPSEIDEVAIPAAVASVRLMNLRLLLFISITVVAEELTLWRKKRKYPLSKDTFSIKL